MFHLTVASGHAGPVAQLLKDGKGLLVHRLKRRGLSNNYIGVIIDYMKYVDGGGLTPAARQRRETVRMQAAQMFAAGVAAARVAADLEVSQKSAHLWRRAWRAGGDDALRSKGPSGQAPRLTEGQMARLEQILDAGAAACGFADQRWTLARVATVIGRRFHVRYSLKGVSLLLHRRGFTVQVPKHQASERDEAAIARWRRYRWPAVKGSRAGWAIVFADEAGQTLKPAKARTWGRRGRTPIVRVRAKGGQRISDCRAGVLPARMSQQTRLPHPDLPRAQR